MNGNRPREIFVFIGAIAVWFLASQFVGAGYLTMVSDTISDSQPSTPSDHTLRFTFASALSSQGSVSLQFDPGTNGFDLSGLVFGDVDIASSGGGYGLAASASGNQLGVAFYSGSNDHMAVKLGGANAVQAGETWTVRIGTNAVGGSNQIDNPPTTGTKNIDITTRNASGAMIDEARAIIVVLLPVDMSVGSATPQPATPTPAGGGGVRPSSCFRIADFNNNCRVNIVDLSILMANWGTPLRAITDLDGNGKVNFIDFSILLYWWTG